MANRDWLRPVATWYLRNRFESRVLVEIFAYFVLVGELKNIHENGFMTKNYMTVNKGEDLYPLLDSALSILHSKDGAFAPPTSNFGTKWRLRKRKEFSRKWTFLARAAERKYQSKTIFKIYLSGSTQRNSVSQNFEKISSIDILERNSLPP